MKKNNCAWDNRITNLVRVERYSFVRILMSYLRLIRGDSQPFVEGYLLPLPLPTLPVVLPGGVGVF